jgi:excisionase family DNA binding protein
MHTTNPAKTHGVARKDVYTTGEVARICNVAPRTVSKWFDSGQLRGYRIPGSKDRRIPIQQLIRFMKQHEIPLNGLDPGLTRVLVVDADRQFATTLANMLARDGAYELLVANGVFDAGLAVGASKPHAILVDTTLAGLAAADLVRTLHGSSDFEAVKLVAMTPTADPAVAAALRDDGFDAVLAKPFDPAQAARAIETALHPAM